MHSTGTLRRYMAVSDLLFQSVHANDVLVSRWMELEKCNRILEYFEHNITKVLLYNLYTGIAVEQKLQHDENGVSGAVETQGGRSYIMTY